MVGYKSFCFFDLNVRTLQSIEFYALNELTFVRFAVSYYYTDLIHSFINRIMNYNNNYKSIPNRIIKYIFLTISK